MPDGGVTGGSADPQAVLLLSVTPYNSEIINFNHRSNGSNGKNGGVCWAVIGSYAL